MAPKRNGKNPITRSTRRRTATGHTTQIEVPAAMVQDIMHLIESLSMNSGAGSSTDPMQDQSNQHDQANQAENMEQERIEQVERLYEVTDVLNHRVVNGNFQFRLRFRGYSEPEWIDDNMCECAEQISDYLKKKKIKTIYIFCRVSTPDQATSDHMSLQAQEAVLRQEMQRFQPYQRVRVYHLSQSAYRRMPLSLEEIGRYANRDDVIMVWRVDRLGRNIAAYVEWLDDLDQRGVTIYSHFENFTYRERRLDFLQSIIHAERESQNIGHRVRLSVRHRRNRGDQHVGTLRYGRMYQDQLDDGGQVVLRLVVPMPAEVAIIREINLNTHLSAAAMAATLNGRGLTRRGRPWTANMITYIRRNFVD